MKIIILASGSEGNCCYVEANGKGILIDAGISYRRMSKELKCQGIDFCDIEAVLVTHEHTDHIRGLATLWKREGLPVYASPGTIRRMSHYVPEAEYRSIYQEMRIGEFNITAIPVSHDAEEPLGFAICDDFSRLMIATDLGCVNERILNEISQSQGVILESNHDVAMLLNGSYSEDLKRRILSQWGHLSNSQCSAALKEAVWKGLKMVVLAHLSKENNLPEIALTQTQKILPRGIKLSTANRSYTTGPFIL